MIELIVQPANAYLFCDIYEVYRSISECYDLGTKVCRKYDISQNITKLHNIVMSFTGFFLR